MTNGPSREFVGTAWPDVLPDPALNAYFGIWAIDANPRGPIPGDLDDLGPYALNVERFGGLDEPYDPSAPLPDPELKGLGQPAVDDDAVERWEFFIVEAAKRNLPMRTTRDAIEFMRHIGLVERVEEDGSDVRWRPVDPMPKADDLLDVNAYIARRRARRQWRAAVECFEDDVLAWVIEQREGNDETATLEISMTDLAPKVRLSSDNVRYGLMAACQRGDIVIHPRPEEASPDQVLAIEVDWLLFLKYHCELSE
jgi:hypothetical protein